MPLVVDIGTLIGRSPGIRRGRPCIVRAGVTVRRIAEWHNLGLTPEEIAARIEHLTLAQIHAALACYHANRDEIDSDITAEEAAVEKRFPTPAKPMSASCSPRTRTLVGSLSQGTSTTLRHPDRFPATARHTLAASVRRLV